MLSLGLYLIKTCKVIVSNLPDSHVNISNVQSACLPNTYELIEMD